MYIFYPDNVKRLYSRKNMKYPTLKEKIKTFFNGPTYIIDNIYLGNIIDALNIYSLKKNNIKYIVNVSNKIPNIYINHIKYYNVIINDNNIEHIEPYINKTLEFIKTNRDKGDGNILVHCKMGASRSASIILSYLMMENEMDLNEAIDYVRDKRKIVNPSKIFINDLISINKSLNI